MVPKHVLKLLILNRTKVEFSINNKKNIIMKSMKTFFRLGTTCFNTRRALEALYPGQSGTPLFEVDSKYKSAFKRSGSSVRMELNILTEEETKELLQTITSAVHELHNAEDLKTKVKLLALVNEIRDLTERIKG